MALSFVLVAGAALLGGVAPAGATGAAAAAGSSGREAAPVTTTPARPSTPPTSSPTSTQRVTATVADGRPSSDAQKTAAPPTTGSSSALSASGAPSTTGGRVSAASAGPTTPTVPAGVSQGPDALTEISQTPWVGPGSATFTLHLGITASNAANEQLVLDVYNRLTTRTGFQAALGGTVRYPYYGPVAFPLSQLSSDPGGGVDVSLPINNPDGGLPLYNSGVYPVQALLETSQGVVLTSAPLTVFLVYVDRTAAVQPRLLTAIVVPIAARVSVSDTGVPGAVPSAAAAVIEGDANVVQTNPVPLTLAVDGTTLRALEQGDAGQRTAVAGLRTAVNSGGDEVLPTTDLPFSYPAVLQAGLGSRLDEHFQAGANDLDQALGAGPARSVWAFSGGTDASTASELTSQGLADLVVPSADLSPLPAAYRRLTLAQPSRLNLGGGIDITVAATDAELSARLSETEQPALVANQILAELAMIDLETPALARGVVLMPGPGGSIDPQVLSILMSGLDGDPLVQATTLTHYFETVPLASSGHTALSRTLVRSRPSVGPLGGVARLQAAESQLQATGKVFRWDQSVVARMQQRLEVSLSSAFSDATRAADIKAVLDLARQDLSRLTLPDNVSITLTSQHGNLPLTVVNSTNATVAVKLKLTSEKLSFVGSALPQGRCATSDGGVAVSCQLVLSQKATTIQVPVEARTSGVFRVQVMMTSPDGSIVLSSGLDTVRSTAISQVGLTLMIGAAFFLVVWWIRNLRHGRRARQLVPHHGDGASAGPDGGAPPTGDAARPRPAHAAAEAPR
jgi:hypothetical protein